MKKNHKSLVTALTLGLAAGSLFLAPKARAIAVSGVNTSGNYMFRMYNPNSGEHFYTANIAEEQRLYDAGWQYEGAGWIAPKAGKPVYRLYNPNAGDHFYTMSTKERDELKSEGWRYEGIGWYSGGKTPLYRAYNPNAKAGAHNYTTNPAEQNNLASEGWHKEGVAWYGTGGGVGAPGSNNYIGLVYGSDNKTLIGERLFTNSSRTEAENWAENWGDSTSLIPDDSDFYYGSAQLSD